MKYFILAALFLLMAPAAIWAQGAQAPAPPASDDLLVDLFSDEVQSGAAQPVPSGGAPLLPPDAPQPPADTSTLGNLPGTPSPVAHPASPGEAVIERTTPETQASQPTTTTTTTRRRTTTRRNAAPRIDPDPTINAYNHHAYGWIPKDSGLSSCTDSYLASRPLYNIRCIGTLTQAANSPYYQGLPRTYRVTPSGANY
ncbi:MAG: hypothetical protein LBE38_02675 [Deltaproteobacteria bacterium]|jgi:hypothetical protein|nr:hypothetical protein [Deltaproteobacteria bacterium]